MMFQITSSDNLYARSNSKTTVRFLLLSEPDKEFSTLGIFVKFVS